MAVCVLTSALQLIFQELTMQMNLLELILKLQQKEMQSGIPWWRGLIVPQEKETNTHIMASDCVVLAFNDMFRKCLSLVVVTT